VTISHTAVITVNVVAEAPAPDQGDTEARPKPDPRARRIIVKAAAANAPPKMAGHATPEDEASSGRLVSAKPPTVPANEISGMYLLQSAQCQINASRMMIGIGTPRNKRSIARPISVSIAYYGFDLTFRDAHLNVAPVEIRTRRR
jgi:hypothetical protein